MEGRGRSGGREGGLGSFMFPWLVYRNRHELVTLWFSENAWAQVDNPTEAEQWFAKECSARVPKMASEINELA